MSVESRVIAFLEDHPHISNSDLRLAFHSDNWNTIRRIKNQWIKKTDRTGRKKKRVNGNSLLKQNKKPPNVGRMGDRREEPKIIYEAITIDTVHSLLLRWSNGEKIDAQLVKNCIDYVKGFREFLDEDEVELDFEEMIAIGKSIKSRRIVRKSAEIEF